MASDQLPLTLRTIGVLRAIFPAAFWERVERTLVTECGPIQVHSPEFGSEAMERIWLAALKLSGGDIGRLDNAILLAQTDWRDLLVAAGFGSDSSAHLPWANEAARIGRRL